MQAPKLLHNVFANNIPSIHATRLNCLIDGVKSLLRSKKLTLTALGRYYHSKTMMRSNIRKFDRLLGNTKLHKELPLFYAAMNKQFWPKRRRPWIHIDWSCLSSRQNLYVLRASLSMKGRGLVVYEEVHDKKNENHHPTHKKFLRNLKAALPETKTPIIVTDAGFRGKWFKAVRCMGYDYVGRLRNNNAVLMSNESKWKKSRSLYARSSQIPTYLGAGLLTLTNKIACHFVIYKGKNKNRKQLTQAKKISQESKSQRHAKSGNNLGCW